MVAAGRLDGAAAEQELRRAVSLKGGAAIAPPPRAAPAPPLRLTTAERWFLAHLLQEAEGVGDALAELQDDDVAELRSAAIFRAAKSLYLKGQTVTAASLAEALDGDDERRVLREIAMAAPVAERGTPLACVAQLRRLSIQRRLKAIQADLDHKRAQGEDDLTLSQEKLKLARELASL